MKFFSRQTAVVWAALLAGSAAVRAAVSTETVTTIAVSTSSGMNAEIGVDSVNTHYAVFVDSHTELLKVARLENGSAAWTVTTVTSEKVGPRLDLAIAPNKVPHVVYLQTEDPAGVRHAQFANNVWTTDSVEEFDSTDTFVSIAVGTDNLPRVAFANHSKGELRFAYVSGSNWVVETAYGFIGGPLAMALTDDNFPRLFSVNDAGGKRYLTALRKNGSGPFEYKELVVGGIASPLRSVKKVGIAVDGSERIHVSYFNENTTGGLYYAKLIGDAWTTPTVVDSAAGAGVFSDIALNSQDEPRIVYYSTGVGFRTAVFTSAWAVSTVDSGALVGAGAGIAFQRFGYFVSAYFDGTAGSLKVATDLPRNLTMLGTILDNNNQPIPGATLQLTGMIKSRSVPVDSGTGSFSVGNLMVGNYTLTPSADGFQFNNSQLSFSPLSSNQAGLAFQGVATGIQTENTVFDPTKGGKVTFHYSVLDGHVSLRIRTLRGAPLRTVVDEEKSAGAHVAEWDGKDESGRPVASGVYLVLFNAPQFESIEKVVVVK